MHICHITSMHPWNDDRIYERACRMLIRLGHQVTLIAIHDGEATVNGVRIIPLKQRTGLGRRIWCSRDAARLARNCPADIYHFHDPDLLPWMVGLAKSGLPVVYDVHENYVARFSMWGLPVGFAGFLAKRFRKYEQACVSSFAGVVAVSDSVQSLFEGHARDGCVVQNVPDLDRFGTVGDSGERSGSPVIYTSGMNSDDRNCRQTIEAVPRVLERYPDAQFVFVGMYEPAGYRERLQELADSLGVTDSVSLGGMLPWEENFRRTATAHIGCVFYSDNPNNRVTIPNRLFEYMLCGLAVVAHDFPELRDVVSKSSCGYLVDSADPRAIADSIIAMLDDPQSIKVMGMNGRNAVQQKYNFRRQCENMVSFYLRIKKAAN